MSPSATGTRPPSADGDEKAVLAAFLGHLRTAVAAKAEGVPEPRVRAAGVPSGTSLLGLLRHLTFVERFVFLGEDTHDWAATWRVPPEEAAGSVIAAYREACARADAVIAACPDLGAPCPRPARGGRTPSMRWALVHMIEETGRHAGHADILREQIDGSTGR